ncbi:hypothetical protein, variant [Verruconis gallopava]|uniref:Life-span regulatory factor domain-containing protein n=1 Tax=Verruconis gallopava TaxID=253628 RepID=A0A0D2ASJ6_9PEZI|nr:uncharacterized protein PV09_06630 [Verruconis gallopava]XP_016212014.1 hypothetical protein, variant [Verruconis gallopava]KIW02144.1 hypothetical protein PV09_06630 [Verruconis gallopava]KIW02145.1 hypothetical protein, variant [Verruconis gallopava]
MATQHQKFTRKHNGKTQKPGLLKRHSAHAVSRSKTVHIRGESQDVDEDIMAASFLQYCATCEKQIVTPSNSILYCSESCRRKDHTHIPSYDTYAAQSPPMTPLQSSSSWDKFPMHDIVPQRSPTVNQYALNRYSYSSFSEDETSFSEDEKHMEPRRESEAERQLRLFAEQAAESHSRTPRPQYKRSSTNYSSMSNAPSLSQSPTSTTAGMSFPYTPVSRPLPPRTNPTYSTSFKFSKSIELVNPYPAMTQMMPTTAPSSLHDSRRGLKSGAGAATSQGIAEGEVIYEKSPIPLSTSGPDQSSLKKLFRFNEMQAGPPHSERY